MKVTKFTFSLLSAMMLAGAAAPALTTFAAETPVKDTSASKSTETLQDAANIINVGSDTPTTLDFSDQDLTRISNYVYLNAFSKQYEIAPAAISGLSTTEYAYLTENVMQMNAFILEMTLSNEYLVSVVDNVLVFEGLNDRSAGVTKFEAHWNYIRVWLSAGAIRTIGSGIQLGSTFIPNKIVSVAVTAVGMALGSAKNGVRFDYNFLEGSVMNVHLQ